MNYSFDAGKLADIFKNDYSEKNPTVIGRSIKNMARKKGATIWNQYFEEENGDWTGSEEQKKMVHDYVAQDVATKYSNSIVRQGRVNNDDDDDILYTGERIVKDIQNLTEGKNKDGLTSDETAELFNSYPLLLNALNGENKKIRSRSDILGDIDNLIVNEEDKKNDIPNTSRFQRDIEKVQARIDELKQYKIVYGKSPAGHLFYVKNDMPQEWTAFNKAHDDSSRKLPGGMRPVVGFVQDQKLIGTKDLALILENMAMNRTDRQSIVKSLVALRNYSGI